MYENYATNCRSSLKYNRYRGTQLTKIQAAALIGWGKAGHESGVGTTCLRRSMLLNWDIYGWTPLFILGWNPHPLLKKLGLLLTETRNSEKHKTKRNYLKTTKIKTPDFEKQILEDRTVSHPPKYTCDAEIIFVMF